MATVSPTQSDVPLSHRKAIIGSPKNFWTHSTRTGFNLTHPSNPSSPITSSPTLTLQTSTSPINISPQKTALVIIDMQNFFLSPAFGRKPDGPGHAACKNLIEYAIPAARKAGIRIVWLNWGLTDRDLRDMPPGVKRAFGFEAVGEDVEFRIHGEGDEWTETEGGVTVDRTGELREGDVHVYRGLGAACGIVECEDGKMVDAGRLLMRDTWNAALYPPLDEMYIAGTKLEFTPDVWIHKDRMSGLWGAKTACEEFLEKEGLRTLLFAGVNTDQCVGGTLTDAFSKGYDCVLLGDGCGTSSPGFAQSCWEWNASRTFGFCVSCEGFAKGVEDMEGQRLEA